MYPLHVGARPDFMFLPRGFMISFRTFSENDVSCVRVPKLRVAVCWEAFFALTENSLKEHSPDAF